MARTWESVVVGQCAAHRSRTGGDESMFQLFRRPFLWLRVAAVLVRVPVRVRLMILLVDGHDDRAHRQWS